MQLGYSVVIFHVKGLGHALDFIKENNHIILNNIDDAVNAEKLITTLMGDNIEARKAYIQENAPFADTAPT